MGLATVLEIVASLTLNAAFVFDDQNPCSPNRVRNMFISGGRMKNVAGPQNVNGHLTVFARVHVDITIEHHKHLRTIVDVPFVGRVGPVQPHSCCFGKPFDVHSFPGLGGGKGAGGNFLHMSLHSDTSKQHEGGRAANLQIDGTCLPNDFFEMKLDRINKRILALLQRDARLPVTAIGKEVGLSRPAVQDRIAALEEAGIIQGYHAAISDGGVLIRALLFVTIAERPCDNALRWLSSLEGVTSVVSLAGEIDAVVSVMALNAGELSALGDTVLASPLIASLETRIVLRQIGRHGGLG